MEAIESCGRSALLKNGCFIVARITTLMRSPEACILAACKWSRCAPSPPTQQRCSAPGRGPRAGLVVWCLAQPGQKGRVVFKQLLLSKPTAWSPCRHVAGGVSPTHPRGTSTHQCLPGSVLLLRQQPVPPWAPPLAMPTFPKAWF